MRHKGIGWNGHTVHGVIFDMDGVIADTRDAHARAWIQFAEQNSQKIDIDDFIRKTFGRGNMENLALFYPDRIDDRDFIARKSQEKEDLFLEYFREDGTPPLAGLREFLEYLDGANVRASVGSSAPRKNIDTVLETFGIRGHFVHIASMEDVARAKPDPEIFLKCCDAMALPPAECVVLEDSIHGLQAARAAGCRAVGFTTMHPAEEIAPLCDAIVEDFLGLPERVGWRHVSPPM